MHLFHSSTHYHQSCSLVTWFYFSAVGHGGNSTRLYGGARFKHYLGIFLFPNLGAFAHFLTTRLNWGILSNCTAAFFPDLGGFCPFWYYQTTRGQPPCWWQHFLSRKSILFSNITMHFLHSYTHRDLDHSCSIFHKSRGTAIWSSFIVGRAMEVTLPDCTEGTNTYATLALTET